MVFCVVELRAPEVFVTIRIKRLVSNLLGVVLRLGLRDPCCFFGVEARHRIGHRAHYDTEQWYDNVWCQQRQNQHVRLKLGAVSGCIHPNLHTRETHTLVLGQSIHTELNGEFGHQVATDFFKDLVHGHAPCQLARSP